MKKLLILLCIALICLEYDFNNGMLLLGGYLRPTGTSDIISRIIDFIAKIYFKIKNIFVRS